MDQALVDRVLTYLTFAEDLRLTLPKLSEKARKHGWTEAGLVHRAAYGALPLSHFNGAEIVTGGKWISSSSNDMLEADREIAELDLGHWSFAMITDPIGVPESKDVPLYKLNRIRRVPLSEFRGMRCRWRSGMLCEIAAAVVYNSGKYESERALYERVRGKWEAIYAGVPVQEAPDSQSDDDLITMAKSAALSRWYDWTVEIGFQSPGIRSLPTVCIPTSCGGAKAAFKLRDIPPGKSRREALRHWVSMHQREAEPDPITIWPYLRGAEEFTQNGMRCRIVPSEYDMKKAKEYQAMRGKVARRQSLT